MDEYDLFRKLSAGAKFNKQRFNRDAERFHLTKKKPLNDSLPDTAQSEDQKHTENEDGVGQETKPEIGRDTEEETSNVLTILGDIVEDDNSKKKKKTFSKQKQLDLRQEKINHIRNVKKISVYGTDVPSLFETFDELQSRLRIPEDILTNIKNCGYETPTPIQMQAIPVMLERREILACAPTGSGKTAAFLIPVIHHLKRPKKKGFRALIVVPTRELAKQIYRESLRLAEGRGLKIFMITKVKLAMKKFGPQSSQRFDLLITTPNRLIYLLRQEPPVLSLKNVEWLVIDESDKLFEAGPQGFRDQLAEIYQACDSASVHRAMFSATHSHEVAEWCRLNLDSLVTVTVGVRNSAVDLVEQELLFVGDEHGKLVAFRNIVQKGLTPPVLVFVQSKERAKELFSELIYDGINVEVIHADRTQLQRDNVVKSFRAGKIWVLICTELMGRGIDFKGVNLVINYDFPPSAITYIHRIGRTGRAGRPGKAITFFTREDSVNLRSIAQVMKSSGCNIPDYMLHLKKPPKEVKKQLERKAPKRNRISVTPHYYRMHERRFQKRKQKMTVEDVTSQHAKSKETVKTNEQIDEDMGKKRKHRDTEESSSKKEKKKRK